MIVLVEVFLFIVLRPNLIGDRLDGVLLDQPGAEQRLPSFLAALLPLHGPVALDDPDDGLPDIVLAAEVSEREIRIAEQVGQSADAVTTKRS